MFFLILKSIAPKTKFATSVIKVISTIGLLLLNVSLIGLTTSLRIKGGDPFE